MQRLIQSRLLALVPSFIEVHDENEIDNVPVGQGKLEALKYCLGFPKGMQTEVFQKIKVSTETSYGFSIEEV